MSDLQSVPAQIPVVIVGMGPTGLMLAGELRLCGVDCLVLGASAMPQNESRALGFTPSTLEMFAHRDMLGEFGPLEHVKAVHFAGIVISADHLSSPHLPVMRYPQYKTEAVLRDRAARLGATVRPGYTVTGIQECGESLETIANGPDGTVRVRSQYVVGCDGAHSTVRRIAGLTYPLTPPSVQMLLADIEHAGLPNNQFGKKTPTGMVMSGPLDDTIDRLIVCDFTADPLERGTRVEAKHLEQAYRNVTGDPLPPGRIRWASSFNDASGMAPSFRAGRILLAGDAAHTHLPAGGQGMNVSIQDAVNLGWKLAAAVHGWAPADLLDTYDTERRQAAAELLANTQAQGQVFLRGAEVDPVRRLLERLFTVPEAASLAADEVTGMALRYDPGGDAPEPVGRLLPTKDLRLPGGDGPPRGLLRDGRGLLLTSREDGESASLARPWNDRVDVVAVPRPGEPDLLVRPDGHVAWTSRAAEPLATALARWFGSEN
ncbi:MAG TPA: FAD-dependent monooxygenase [Spirillospora sp.]|nr:FAD-dependent monooxygenase [Spirillospora sp.]